MKKYIILIACALYLMSFEFPVFCDEVNNVKVSAQVFSKEGVIKVKMSADQQELIAGIAKGNQGGCIFSETYPFEGKAFGIFTIGDDRFFWKGDKITLILEGGGENEFKYKFFESDHLKLLSKFFYEKLKERKVASLTASDWRDVFDLWGAEIDDKK